ncbi:LysM peptidoglycan-binding domain-containing protein [Thermodesulfitimonas sp.]
MAEAAPKDAPSRVLDVEVLISCRILVVEPRQLDVVTAVTGAAVVEKAKLRVEAVVSENSTTVLCTEVPALPPADPPVARILTTEPLSVTVVAAEVIDDAVATRGRASVRVIYVAATPVEGVYAADAQLDFTARVSVRGAKPGYGVHVSPAIDYAVVRVKESGIVVDAAVTVPVKVTETVQQEVITCVKLPENFPAPPVTLVQHTVTPGDTFYNLAERYGTTVEAIMAANPGVDPDHLQVGQVVNIPVTPGDPA